MSRKLFPNKTNICKQQKVTPAKEEILCSWPGCQRTFVRSENLKKHLKAHNEDVLECIYCHRQFPSQSTLKYHIRIHTGEKPYQCSLCSKSFATLGNLKKHTRIHTLEKEFKCNLCQKSFSSMTILEDHIRFHTGEKPYNCKTCAKSFATISSLVVHQRIHNGDKPYKCTVCSKSFSQLGHLQAHVRIHTGERPYKCKFCPKSFAHKTSLQYHMKIHKDKMPRARSFGCKCNTSNDNLHTKKVEKNEEQNTPKNCKQRAKRGNKDVRRHNEGAPIEGAITTRMHTKYKEKPKQPSSLTCQVCYLETPSLENLCRHYSLQHNLPNVVMQNIVIQSRKFTS